MVRCLTGLLAAVVMLAACSDGGWRGFRLDNQTDAPVTVTSLVNGRESTLSIALGPGLNLPITGYPGDQCVTMTLIARDGSHQEISRFDGPVCLDQTWVIRRPGEPAGSG
jgi:hypothetical protein